VKAVGIHPVVHHVQGIEISASDAAQLAGVDALGTTHTSALRKEVRVQVRKKRALTGECSPKSVKKVASCKVTTVAAGLASGIV
jgi:hypothetical protein